jgi:hypothetical protein
MLLNSSYVEKKLGDPSKLDQHYWFCTLDRPKLFNNSCFPVKISNVNRIMATPLANALVAIGHLDLEPMITSYDGIYCLRKMRLSTSWSLHSWAIAIDINAVTNRQGAKPMLDMAIVNCFEACGFDWGGRWKGASVDGMHFQLSKETFDTQLKRFIK